VDARCPHTSGASHHPARLAAKAHVLGMSHLGRPEGGKVDEAFSLAPVQASDAMFGVPVA